MSANRLLNLVKDGNTGCFILSLFIFMQENQFSEQEISYICDLLKRWEQLPIKYKEQFFWKEIEKKEYELKYAWKEREEDILASTYASPLQKVKTFDEENM